MCSPLRRACRAADEPGRRRYLEENAAAVEVELSDDDLARIEAELPEVAGERHDQAGMKAVNL
jgi:hypothetical protein